MNSNLDCFEWEVYLGFNCFSKIYSIYNLKCQGQFCPAEGHPLSCAPIQYRLASYAHVVQSAKVVFQYTKSLTAWQQYILIAKKRGTYFIHQLIEFFLQECRSRCTRLEKQIKEVFVNMHILVSCYHVARNVCGSLFFADWRFLCFAGTN